MQENLYHPTAIRTRSGRYIDPMNPKAEDILIEDIAHALSNQCRFGGHLPKFYSVAQHSIFCCNKASNGNKLAALLHDASEAYLIDLPTPIKRRLPEYINAEQALIKVIAEKFGFEFPFVDEIKTIDREVLELEWNCLVINYPNIAPLTLYNTPIRAYNEFLYTYKQLTKKDK